MAGSWDQIPLHLPGYLTLEARAALMAALSRHPSSPSVPFATAGDLAAQALQGDIVRTAPFYDIVAETGSRAGALLVSNSCDMSAANSRAIDRHVQYCPVLPWSKFSALLSSTNQFATEESQRSLEEDVRNQYVTNLFHIGVPGNPDGFVAFLDQIQSARSSTALGIRKWSLTQFGHYMLLFKLSYHFSRMREGLQRSL